MKSKNLTPFLFAGKVTSRRPPEPEMVLIVRAKFKLEAGAPLALPEGHPVLAQGTLRGDVFRDDDDDQTGECLYPSDFADWKPRADVLLRGTCYTPGGTRVTSCPVRFGVGEWSKSLRVVGPRVWMEWRDGALGQAMSDYVPFDRMPIDDQHSFGGPGHPQNPVGKGFHTRELPNIENPGDILTSRSDRPTPAGFGPLSPHRPERRAKVGKHYGASYRAKRAPYYADDFDWSYFNAAPPDQQVPYLRGDEELLFQNLHPHVEMLRARLPGLRIRAFASDLGGRFREAPMNLDTLLADLDEGALYLTWRGLTDAKEDDLSDQTVLIASEPLAEPPLPEAHYRDILARFEADPLEIAEHLPPELEGEWRALEALGKARAEAAPQADAQPGDAPNAPLASLLAARLGGLAKPAQAQIRAALESLSGVALPDGRRLERVMGEALRAQRLGAPAAAPLSPEAAPPVVANAQSRRAFRALARAVEEERARAAAQGTPLQGMDAWDKLRADPKLAAMGLSPVEPRDEGDIGPDRDLSGRDLSDRDLSGRDLSGADLSGAILAGTNLRGAKLTGAKLLRAVLFEADLQGADLEGADLSLATLQGARAERAIFRGATLDFVSFEGARLAGADLSGTRGSQIIVSRADLTGAVAKGAQWHMALVEAATLAKADFSGASVTRSFIAKCDATSATFAAATITGTSFAESDLTGAVFTGAHGDGSIWMGATLTGADLGYATLKSAHFTEARATEARFFGANLRQARFYKATLERADFTRANLFDADLHKAVVTEAKFVDANLYDAKLYQTSGAGCDFRGANLKRSTLARDV